MTERVDLFPISLHEEIRCVEREIMLRKRNYPRFVAGGRMTQQAADKQIALMESVLKRLESLVK